MIRLLKVTTLLATGIASAALSLNLSAQETGYTYIERELHYLMKLWPGDYDNQEQVSFDARAAVEPGENARFHALVKVIELPELGEHVLYLEETRGDDAGKVYRQRVYALSADEQHKAIRVKSYRIENAVDFTAEAVTNLNTKSLSLLEGCDLLLRRDSDSFAGQLESQRCDDGGSSDLDQHQDQYTSQDAGLLERHVRISADLYSFNDRRVSAEGKVLSSVANFSPRKLKRARWFACMVDVPKKTPMLSNHTQHYIKIHDQGGQFDFTHPDGRELTLLMRNTWSYGMQRETFFIGIFEGGATGKLVVYSWGTPGADRIGMNPGYIRIQCDLDTPENVKMQHGLRVDS